MLAMVHYFFTIASSVWWLILCFAWFLAATLKWGEEAIQAQSAWFHLFGWGTPCALFIFALIFSTIDGDLMTGICSVGNWDPIALRNFLLIPHLFCLGK